MDARKHLGILCICAILLYFSTAIMDYVTLFSGNLGAVNVESITQSHVFYTPWQICWIVENSFTCKNFSWKSTIALPAVLLLLSVIIGKILFLGCLYQLLCIFKFKRPITLFVAVALKIIICALSLILHIVVILLPKDIINGQKLISLWNSDLTVIISTGLIIILMLVLLIELFYIINVFCPILKNNSDLHEDGYMNPLFHNESPVRTRFSTEQLDTDQSVGDSEFSWKDLSVEYPSNIVSASLSNDSSKDDISYYEYQKDNGLPNNDSDSCSTGFCTRDLKNNHDINIHKPIITTGNEEISGMSRSQEIVTKEPNANGIIIKGQNNMKLRSVSEIKLRANVEQKIIKGHRIVPFKETVLLLRRNIQQEWELAEMKAYVFQNSSESDSKLVIFEFKNCASQQDFTEVKPNSEHDETPNFKTVCSYPYYYPHNTSVPNVKYSSKCNLAIPTKK